MLSLQHVGTWDSNLHFSNYSSLEYEQNKDAFKLHLAPLSVAQNLVLCFFP